MNKELLIKLQDFLTNSTFQTEDEPLAISLLAEIETVLPLQEPFTDNEIRNIYEKGTLGGSTAFTFARDIEEAHGIK